MYVGSIKPIASELYNGKGDEAAGDGSCREAYRSIRGAIVWTVLTRVELAVYAQVLQRRVHAPEVTNCKRLNFVIRYMKKHKCGSDQVVLNTHWNW